MQVHDIMQKHVITATPDMSLARAQRLMHEHHSRHLPVVSGRRLVGIVTDRDLREASPSPATTLSQGEIAYQMNTIRIETCMTRTVVHVPPDMDMVQGACLLLNNRFGCLPVVENHSLVGLVSEIDFLQAFLQATPSA